MLNQDFKEFIQLLNDNHVRYLVVGGYALAFHGHPRYTKDIDIWVDATFENAKIILNVLHLFGFASLGLAENDFLDENKIIQLGYPPCRIDLLTSIDGVIFNEAYSNKIQTIIDDVTVNFIDRLHLKANKKASGRLQDLADLESIK